MDFQLVALAAIPVAVLLGIGAWRWRQSIPRLVRKIFDFISMYIVHVIWIAAIPLWIVCAVMLLFLAVSSEIKWRILGREHDHRGQPIIKNPPQ